MTPSTAPQPRPRPTPTAHAAAAPAAAALNLDALSDGALADEIVAWSGRLAAGEARLLELVGEFDRRDAWAGPGLLSCAHWLAWRVGLSPGAARERVRVARRLPELPLVRAALAAGTLSYSQVRAITRAATPEDESRWVEMARHSTAGQLERLARGVHRVRRAEQDAADPEAAAYRLRVSKRYDEDGTAVYTLRLSAEDAVVVDAALEQVRGELDHAASLTPREDVHEQEAQQEAQQEALAVSAGPAPRATLGDALLEVARRTVEGRDGAGELSSRRARAGLVVQVDPLSGWGRLRDGEVLPPTSLRTALRALPGRGTTGLRPLRVEDLRRHDLGRSRRTPSDALRRLLGVLDGERCRYPGCTRHRRLHAHHVVHWEHGGPTDLGNLVLLCPRHHTLVHALGTGLVLRADRRLEVTTADGTRVPHLPPLPWRPAAELDPAGDVSAETLPPPLADQRLDLGYAVMVLVQQAA